MNDETLGYLGTAGAEAGHPTSEDRAEQEATTGRAARRQMEALSAVDAAGWEGLTWYELAVATGWHHGQATSALSNLHRRGMLARLKESRQGSGIYVVPELVSDRETMKQGRRYSADTLARDVPLAVLREALRIATAVPPHERTPEPVRGFTGPFPAPEVPVPAEVVALLRYPLSINGSVGITSQLDKEYGPGLLIRTDVPVDGWMVLAREKSN
jgi:hypothetical protein